MLSFEQVCGTHHETHLPSVQLEDLHAAEDFIHHFDAVVFIFHVCGLRQRTHTATLRNLTTFRVNGTAGVCGVRRKGRTYLECAEFSDQEGIQRNQRDHDTQSA